MSERCRQFCIRQVLVVGVSLALSGSLLTRPAAWQAMAFGASLYTANVLLLAWLVDRLFERVGGGSALRRRGAGLFVVGAMVKLLLLASGMLVAIRGLGLEVLPLVGGALVGLAATTILAFWGKKTLFSVGDLGY